MGRREDGGDNFSDSCLADLAVAIVDAALGQREVAATGTGIGVEFVERDGFLFGRELGKIDAGKLAGAVGMLQENFSGVLKRFHFDVTDGQAKERTDFRFIKDGVAQAFVFLHDSAFGVEHKRSRQRGDAAVFEAEVVGRQGHGIINVEFSDEFLDGLGIVVVHDKAEDLEVVFVFILQLDEVGDFGAAGSTPGGPEIQEDDFALGIREGDGLAVDSGELEVRRGIRIADKADSGLLVFLSSNEGRSDTKK